MRLDGAAADDFDCVSWLSAWPVLLELQHGLMVDRCVVQAQVLQKEEEKGGGRGAQR